MKDERGFTLVEMLVALSLFAAIAALGALNGFVLLQGEIPRDLAHRPPAARALHHQRQLSAQGSCRFEGAILQIEANQRAFEWGRATAHDAEAVRNVFTAQMGKDGPPMFGKDLHTGDFEWGVLPAAACRRADSCSRSCSVSASTQPSCRRMPLASV